MDEDKRIQLHPYTVVLDYYATGEGVTWKVTVLMAEDAEEAKEKFLSEHGYEGEGREYFRVGVEANRGINAELLGRVLNPQFISALERRVRFGVFTASWHYNMS